MKICTVCKLEKDEGEFYPNGKNLRSYCKDCFREKRKASDPNYGKYTPSKTKKTENGKLCHRYVLMKGRAKANGWEITDWHTFRDWFNGADKRCHYCGVTADALKETGRTKTSLSVDRKDNKVGYVVDNMALACHRCNNIKSDFFTEADMMKIAELIKPRIQEYHRPV